VDDDGFGLATETAEHRARSLHPPEKRNCLIEAMPGRARQRRSGTCANVHVSHLKATPMGGRPSPPVAATDHTMRSTDEKSMSHR